MEHRVTQLEGEVKSIKERQDRVDGSGGVLEKHFDLLGRLDTTLTRLDERIGIQGHSTENCPTTKRVHALQLRVAAYIGGASVLIWLISHYLK